jgi:ribosomal protein S18
MYNAKPQGFSGSIKVDTANKSRKDVILPIIKVNISIVKIRIIKTVYSERGKILPRRVNRNESLLSKHLAVAIKKTWR